MSGDLRELTRAGRLANVLCRLAGSRFTGLVYAEHEQQSVVISMRSGRAVFVEDLAEQTTISDTLLEQGLVTKEQYADIATRVIETLADNEDFAFCQLAVELGMLTQEEVDNEVERRIRGRLIQAVAWEQCRIEIDEDPDALTGIFEYPQDIGPLIYMGVRTFFDDERVRTVIGTEADVYGRLLRAPQEIAQFFQLEPEEAALLAGMPGDVALARVIEDKAVDALEGWQIVCLLLLADMVELGPSPFSSPAERSGVRSTHSMAAVMPPADRAVPAQARAGPGQARMPSVREDQVSGGARLRAPIPREEGAPHATDARTQQARASQARMPAIREEQVFPASRPRAPVPREEPGAHGAQARTSALREEYVGSGSRPRMPAAREQPPRPSSQQRTPAVREERASSARNEPARPAAQPADRAPSSTAHAARAPSQAQPMSGEPASTPRERGNARPLAPTNVASAEPLPAHERPLPRKRPPRKLSAALQRLDRELKYGRPQQAGAAPVAPPASPAATPSVADAATYARAHVDQIMRMRNASLAQKQSGPTKSASTQTPAEFYRLGHEALRDQQFGRAHELLRKACDGDPNNEIYAMFCMWAAFRSNALQGDALNKLRLALRGKVSDDEHRAFAYYALGHIALHEKKDDAAEKFFRKAIEFNKNNKDAERHLRIIELRRKTAAQGNPNKIFGIEIGGKKT